MMSKGCHTRVDRVSKCLDSHLRRNDPYVTKKVFMNKKTINLLIIAGCLFLIFGWVGNANAASSNNNLAQTEMATICVNAFHDENANGQHEDNEGFMAGVTFIIADESVVIAQAVSNGTDKAVCFENLTPGTYQVAQDVPAPLEMTTAANTSIEAVAGNPIGLEFGSRVPVQNTAPTESVDAEPTAVSTEEPAAETSGNNLVAWGGLLVIILAVVLLGIIIFALLRR